MWVSREKKQTGKPKYYSTDTSQHNAAYMEDSAAIQTKCLTLRHMVTLLFLILRETLRICVCVITKITGDVMEHEEPQPPLALFLTNQDSIAVAYHSHSCQRLKIPVSGPLS